MIRLPRRRPGVLAAAGLLIASGLAADAPGPAPAPPSRAWLGVFLGDAVDGGVQLVAVVRGGPAHRAGLREGDVVLQVDEWRISDVSDLAQALGRLDPGDSVGLQALRAGTPIEAAVRLDVRPGHAWPALTPPDPPAPPPQAERPSRGDAPAARAEAGPPVGLAVVEMPPELRVHYGAPESSGVLVTRLPNAAADRAGLEIGDVIVEVAGRPVSTPAEFLAATAQGAGPEDGLSVRVIRARSPRTISVVPRSLAAEAAAEPTRDEEAVRREIRALEERIGELRRRLLSRADD